MQQTIKDDVDMSIAFVKATQIRHEKKKDYGGLEGYFPFGAKSYCHELNKKTLRLMSLELAGATPAHESIQDNLLDLINYASYYYEYLYGGGEDNAKDL